MSHENATDLLPDEDREELSGRFAIDRRGALLPPPGDAPEVKLEDLVAEPAPRQKTVPPPVPVEARSVRPSAFDDDDDLPGDDAPIVDPDLRDFSVTVPPPAEVNVYERAQLQVSDMSLRLDNPYAASSLVPPPARTSTSPWRVMAVAVALLAVGGGAFVLGARSAASGAQVAPAPAPTAAVAAVAAPAEPVPVAAAAPAPVAAQVVEAQPQAEPAAEAVAPVAPAAEPEVAAVPVVAAPVANVEPKPAASTHHSAGGATAEPAAPAAEAVPASAAEAAEPAVASTAVAPTTAAVPATAPAAAEAAPGTEPAVAEAAAAPAEAAAAPAEAAAAPAEATPAADLPEAPSREQIVEGFESVHADLLTCAAGNHGMLKVQATILGSGRVSQALIDGVFRGTPEGSCMARALRKAKFVQFAQPSLSIAYPFSL
jgi:hypothetical protein